jgi:hypothetical protein
VPGGVGEPMPETLVEDLDDALAPRFNPTSAFRGPEIRKCKNPESGV